MKIIDVYGEEESTIYIYIYISAFKADIFMKIEKDMS
jgi:hypothetical protein